MRSQRHNQCKAPDAAKNIKKNDPPAGRFVSKSRASSQKSVNGQFPVKLEHVKNKASSTSRLPVPIGRKAPKFETCNGVLNFKGLSNVDTKHVDASVSTESEGPLSCSSVNATVGTEALSVTKAQEKSPNLVIVDLSVGPLAQASIVDMNVGHLAQASIVDLSVDSLAKASSVDLIVGPLAQASIVDMSVGHLAQASIVDLSVGRLAKTSSVDLIVGPLAQASIVDTSVGHLAQASIVDLSVGLLAQASSESNPNTKDQKLSLDDLMLVKHDSDLAVVHRQLDHEATFELYKNKLAKISGSDMKETVREIGQKLISDEVLMQYSYCGQRTKGRFKDFSNITKLVVASTIQSLKRRYFEIYGKEKVESDEEKKSHYDEAEAYFTKEYVKDAKRRHQRSLK